MVNQILSQLGNSKLVAVSKTRSNEQIMAIYNQGQRLFGENRVQELVGKYETLPKDISWHLIGQLQKNKVKYIGAFVDTIHSIDSFLLLKEVNKQAKKHDRVIKVLLQIKVAQEDTKSGMHSDETTALLENVELKALKNIQICGIMGMATFTDNQAQIRNEFKEIKSTLVSLKKKYFSKDDAFSEVSMGMSSDYKIAIEEGATMVRIGSLLFK